jgi:ABC-type glycerol-3-phosphate transport system permease component
MRIHIRKRTNRLIGSIIISLLVAIVLGLIIFPLIWIALDSLKTPEELFKPGREIALPTKITLSNYRLLGKSGYGVFFKNSLILATGTGLCGVVICSLIGYALARLRSGASSKIFLFLVITQMFPRIVVILPFYLIMRYLHLLNTHIGLILLYTAFGIPFATWLMKAYFQSIPFEIEEAALVDGCSVIQTVLRITLPLSMPGAIATFMYLFVFTWNDYLIALILTQNWKSMPIAVAIQGLEGGQAAMEQYGMILACAVLICIPPIVIFAFLQKFLIKGATLGGVKT